MNMWPGRRRPRLTTLSAANVEHAGLGAEHDPAVVGDQPAARAQAVAVERRGDAAAVGGDDRGRAVPRLESDAW